jgi:hypothetical protein
LFPEVVSSFLDSATLLLSFLPLIDLSTSQHNSNNFAPKPNKAPAVNEEVAMTPAPIAVDAYPTALIPIAPAIAGTATGAIRVAPIATPPTKPTAPAIQKVLSKRLSS